MHYWEHADEAGYGVFHTYDALALPGFGPRKVHVLLPHDHERHAALPVAYFNDGNTTFWPGGLAHKSWYAQHALAAARGRGEIGPVVAVAVHPLERDQDYTLAPWAPGRACCGLASYAESLARGLHPFLRERYGLSSSPQSTAIVGSSHGGTAAFYIATRFPDVFGLAGVMSPSLWVGASYNYASPGLALEDAELVGGVAELLANRERRPWLWVDWGRIHEGGFHNEVIERLAMERGRELVALLRERYGYAGRELQVCEDALGAHDEESWCRRLPSVLAALFAPNRRAYEATQ